MAYQTPEFRVKSFTCPYCSAIAQMHWSYLLDYRSQMTCHWQGVCTHCEKASIWEADDIHPQPQSGRMVWPRVVTAPAAHEDMPEDVRRDYDEARQVATYSPRAACALLRVAIERLCISLQATGRNVNERIGFLVAQGLPVRIQQALDAVRVVGNNAVHPGVMSEEDVAEVSISLFALVNLIVDDRIAGPKAVNAIFAGLPAEAIKAIERRDQKAR